MSALTTKTKLMFTPFDPDRFARMSPADPAIVAKINAIAPDRGVSL